MTDLECWIWFAEMQSLRFRTRKTLLERFGSAKGIRFADRRELELLPGLQMSERTALMDKDGTKSGYDNRITALISENVGVPVIASGGAGSMKDFADAVNIGKADAVLAASLFHFGEIKISDLKDYLEGEGIPVRREL